jgi:SAM-dependent methyltransferase
MLDIPMDLWPPNDRSLLFQDEAGRHRTSRAWVGYLKKYTELTPSSAVLEIGFGAGRTARALWDYISPAGSYCGIDVNEGMVDWHSHNITPLRPNVRFFHADVTNAVYRSVGVGSSPAKYVFPFDDKSFDVVFLASVFTHMFPADVANYLREIRRVLRPGGWVLASCFLIDDAVQERMEEGLSKFQFTRIPDHPHTWTGHPRISEGCMGYSAAAHRKLYKDTKLEIVHLFPGNWSGVDPRHETTFTGQDIVVARRPVVGN